MTAPESAVTGPTALSSRGWLGVLALWLASRLVMVATALRVPMVFYDLGYYWRNAREHSLLTGMPEYPLPIAVALMAPARALSLLDYRVAFVLVLAVLDLAVTVVLCRRIGVRAAGFWIGFVLCVGPISYARFDLPVAACVVLVLVWNARRPWLAGLAAATGAAIKLWPAVFGAGLGGPVRLRLRQAVATATGLIVCVGLTLAVAGPDRLTSPLTWQAGRGFEFEAPISSVLGLLRVHGVAAITTSKRFGSEEYVGPLAADLLPLVHVVTYAGYVVVAALVVLSFRAVPRSALVRQTALTATAVTGTLVLTSPVLSPQYLLWLAPGLAVGAATGAPRALVPLSVGAALLSQLEFPFTYNLLFEDTSWRLLPAWAIAVRNCLLIAVVVIAILQVIRPPSRFTTTGAR